MQEKKSTYQVLGVMSGTSLDGLDLVLCRITASLSGYESEILEAETIPYTKDMQLKLMRAPERSGLELAQLNVDFGTFIGQECKSFLQKHQFTADFISSHGHTVFHQPEKKLTLQIGDGAAIAAHSGITTVCDFRTMDVALGGQGAPLVPIGDELLFNEYDYCLNIGGIANISYKKDNKRIAFDICPANIVLNNLSRKLGLEFDKEGLLGAKGTLVPELLNQLNSLSFYDQKPPKSLGFEWIEQYVFPLLENSETSIENQLRTLYEHISIQIKRSIPDKANHQILITGGGAKNNFLINLLKSQLQCEVVVPDARTIEFKEGLIFALLGVLRIEEKVNCLKEVTGASSDNIGGAVYLF